MQFDDASFERGIVRRGCFHQDEQFSPDLDPPLPTVNRFDIGKDIRAGDQLFFHKDARGRARRLLVRPRAQNHEHVFSTGNVVTGKGNILESRRHSRAVAGHVVEQFLGAASVPETEAQHQLADMVESKPGLDKKAIERLLARVRARQEAVGYTGTYEEWIARVTPPDLA